MPLEHATDHEARGLARLTSRFRKPATQAALGAALAEVQGAEDALWTVAALSLDDTTGAQLDQVGALVGEARAALDDEPYRSVLRARVLANRSGGTFGEVAAVLAVFADDPADAALDEYSPAALLATLDAMPGVPAARVAGLLRRAKAGGVGLQLVAPAGHDPVFRFASGDDVETTFNLGLAPDDQSTGGRLAGVY